jgi:hypothetical protein
MTTTPESTSFLANLKNKIVYTAHKAVYDPSANEFVVKQQTEKEQNQTKQSDTTSEKNLDRKSEDTKTENKDKTNDISGNITLDDPNTFSGKRLAKKVFSQFFTVLKYVILPFIGLMIAMIVANEMIVYSVPIRIIFFIFTFLIVTFYPVAMIALPFFYILKGGYSYYINNMTDEPKREIMPTIHALLPVTTMIPTTKLGSILLYPFQYPKSEKGEIELENSMKNYIKSLEESVKNFDAFKSTQVVQNSINKSINTLSKLHVKPKLNENQNQNQNENQNQNQNIYSDRNNNED